MTAVHDLGSLTDNALLDRFGELVHRDHRLTAQLLRSVDEVDRRQLWAKYGHPSMFDFCVVRFHMSESEAGKRIGAARAARRFPVLFDMVARGELHLSGIHRLKAHLTDDNHREVLAEARHKTIKELEQLVARLCPQPDAPSKLRALPARPRPAPDCAVTPVAAQDRDREESPAQQPETRPPFALTPRSPDPMPLSPRRYKLQVTLDEPARDVLVQLQGLMAHQVPDGDPAAIVTRALGVLLEQTLKTKTAASGRPRAPRPPAPGASRSSGPSRSIPAHIRRRVWERDQGQCAFVGAGGRRCGERRKLEYAHIHPWAKGGEHSETNIALRCRGHNSYEAVLDYGEAFMKSKLRSSPGTRSMGA